MSLRHVEGNNTLGDSVRNAINGGRKALQLMRGKAGEGAAHAPTMSGTCLTIRLYTASSTTTRSLLRLPPARERGTQLRVS